LRVKQGKIWKTANEPDVESKDILKKIKELTKKLDSININRSKRIKYRTGAIPDIPDHRDFTIEDIKNIQMQRNAPALVGAISRDSTREERFNELVNIVAINNIELMNFIDLVTPVNQFDSLRDLFPSHIEHQGRTSSCTAHAATAIIEYFDKVAFGHYENSSRLFLYKTARNYMKITGDNGASLRATIAAMRLFGVPPEEYWEFDETKVNEEPTAFCYSLAKEYQAIRYLKLDPPGTRWDVALNRMKRLIECNIPSMFTFTVYDYYFDEETENTGRIRQYRNTDIAAGFHAVVAVGYDDDDQEIIFRNSRGPGWGDGGYGYLPYDYVQQGLANNFWVILNKEWVDTKRFGFDVLRDYPIVS